MTKTKFIAMLKPKAEYANSGMPSIPDEVVAENAEQAREFAKDRLGANSRYYVSTVRKAKGTTVYNFFADDVLIDVICARPDQVEAYIASYKEANPGKKITASFR